MLAATAAAAAAASSCVQICALRSSLIFRWLCSNGCTESNSSEPFQSCTEIRCSLFELKSPTTAVCCTEEVYLKSRTTFFTCAAHSFLLLTAHPFAHQSMLAKICALVSTISERAFFARSICLMRFPYSIQLFSLLSYAREISFARTIVTQVCQRCRITAARLKKRRRCQRALQHAPCALLDSINSAPNTASFTPLLLIVAVSSVLQKKETKKRKVCSNLCELNTQTTSKTYESHTKTCLEVWGTKAG